MEQYRTVVLPAVRSPVSTSELGAWLRLDSDEQTSLVLPILLEAATKTAMDYCNRSFLEQTVRVRYDGFPGYGTETKGLDALIRQPFYWITLPYTPLISVDAVRIIDQNGNAEIVPATDYEVDLAGGRINFKKFFPAFSDDEILEIEYTAGYGTEGCDIPAGIKMGIMKIAAYSYEHRGDCDPVSQPSQFRDLLAYKVMDRL